MEPPTDDSKEQCMEEDARLYPQIRNSIDSEVIDLINHFEFVKELMDYLEFLILEKGMSHEYLRYARLFIDLKNKPSLLLPTSWNSRKLMRS